LLCTISIFIISDSFFCFLSSYFH
ncbi:hypothetical protein KM1_270550, partial [Entamoeba histolytica HM-3:IMSS]